MIGVKPCPYCGGEVEVVKLVKNERERKERLPQPYRIECRHCHRLVARGRKFEIETVFEGEQRLKDYDAFMNNLFPPMNKPKRALKSNKNFI